MWHLYKEATSILRGVEVFALDCCERIKYLEAIIGEVRELNQDHSTYLSKYIAQPDFFLSLPELGV